MRRALCLLPFLAALAVGCAAPADDGSDDGASAFAEGRATSEAAAKGAADLAERINEGAPEVVRISVLTDEAESVLLPSESARVGAWSLQALFDTKVSNGLGRGFLLQPQGEDVPSGSFVVVVGDGTSVVARAVYVPDEASDARGWATTLLDAVEADAKAYGAAETELRIQGAAGLAKGAWSLVAKFLPKAGGAKTAAAAEKAAATARAEARMTSDSGLWKDFASYFERTGSGWKIADMSRDLTKLRTSLGDRTVVVVDSNLRGKPCASGSASVSLPGCQKMVDDILATLSEKLAGRNVALATPIGAEISPAALLWALEKRVPIVITAGGTETGASVIKGLANRSASAGNKAMAAKLEAAAADPELVSLVKPINTYGMQTGWRTTSAYPQSAAVDLADAHEQMTPLWALADEALSLNFLDRGRSVFANFLGYFQTHAQVELRATRAL